MIKELIKLADHLDAKGLRKEADYLDKVIKKAYYGKQHGKAQQMDMSFQQAQAKAKNSKSGVYYEQADGDITYFGTDGNASGVGDHMDINENLPYYYEIA